MPTLEQTATATTTTVLKLKPTVRKKLLTSLKIYSELRSQLKAIESAMDKQKGIIGDIREESGEQNISLEGFSITLVAPVRSSLDKSKLIAQGVTMEQIEKATVTKASKAYTKVTCPNSGTDEEND